ncbi:MAG TPA: hypothetical protein VFP65_09290 [Anaeromyxobacteraceae bacterium]|nr:hypothetical protein [Anaeromyxobacteraceae bacterium]
MPEPEDEAVPLDEVSLLLPVPLMDDELPELFFELDEAELGSEPAAVPGSGVVEAPAEPPIVLLEPLSLPEVALVLAPSAPAAG